MSSPSPPSLRPPSLGLPDLPDELLGLCYASLPASDLVSLEAVSRRLRTLVSTDEVAWERSALARWGAAGQRALLRPAVAHAGSWKKLYAEKLVAERDHAPWTVPCASETAALLRLVRSGSQAKGVKGGRGGGDSPRAGTSPRAVSELARPRRQTRDELAVVLLLDGSSSVTEDDFRAMKAFCDGLARSLSDHPTPARLAVVQFNQHPKVELPLEDASRPGLLRDLAALEQMMGSTDIAAPLRRARTLLADDPAANPVVLLLSDGQTHAEELLDAQREAAQARRDAGARVFTLGVGRDVDVKGLSRIAAARIAEGDAEEEGRRVDPAMGAYFALRCMQSSP